MKGIAIAASGRWLYRLLPFLNWIGELKNPAILRADIIAGLTVALVLVPQGMAYAQLAGLPAYYGLYAAFLPPIVGALLGSSRQLSTGPAAVVSLMTAAALAPIATSGSTGYVVFAVLLAFLVGIFQLALGFLRLGVLVNFISHPAVIGFTNAAAIIIATSQLGSIFGVRAENAKFHFESVWNTLNAAFHSFHGPTLAVAFISFALIMVLRRFARRLPSVLIAVIATTALSVAIDFEKLQTATPAQFADSHVREVLDDRARLTTDIAEYDRARAAAERRLEETTTRYGAGDGRTREAQQAVEMLKIKHDRRLKSAAIDFKQLQQRQYRFVPSDDGGGTYYPLGALPEGAIDDGNGWRLRRLADDGSIVMSGGGEVIGTVPLGLPSFQAPTWNFDVALQLLSAAIAIGLIGFIEGITIAKAMATKARSRIDANQELVGQGFANIVASFSQTFPVSASFSRSAVNMDAGAKTGFASAVAGLMVLATLLWLTPLLYHLPQATLAAVIMVAVLGLINVRGIRDAWKAQRQDGIVAIVTFVLTLVFAPALDKGILLGAAIALVLYLYRSMQPRVAILSRHADGTLRDAEVFSLNTCHEVAMVRFDGSLFFANTGYFEDKVQERVLLQPELRYVVVVGDGINEIDATGEEMLAHLAQRLNAVGIQLLFTGLKKQVLEVFYRTGFYERIGAHWFFRTEEHALASIWHELGEAHRRDCPLNVVLPKSELNARRREPESETG